MKRTPKLLLKLNEKLITLVNTEEGARMVAECIVDLGLDWGDPQEFRQKALQNHINKGDFAVIGNTTTHPRQLALLLLDWYAILFSSTLNDILLYSFMFGYCQILNFN